MNAHAESTTLGDVLKGEAPNLYSREAVTVLAGDGAERALKVGAVIARRTRSTVTVTAGDGNTGDGEATLSDPPLGARAEAGIYRLACITAGAAGAFQVLSPKGYRLPELTVGEAYEGDHLNLTIADGATDFAVGDTFAIEVSGDGKVVGLDPAAVDGTAQAIGIAAFDVTALTARTPRSPRSYATPFSPITRSSGPPASAEPPRPPRSPTSRPAASSSARPPEPHPSSIP